MRIHVIQRVRHSNGTIHHKPASPPVGRRGCQWMSIINALMWKLNARIRRVIWMFTNDWYKFVVTHRSLMAPTSQRCCPATSLHTNGQHTYELIMQMPRLPLNENYLFFFSSIRQAPAARPYVVVLNLGKEWKTVDVKARFNVTQQLRVVTASIQSQYSEGYVRPLFPHYFQFSRCSFCLLLQWGGQRDTIDDPQWRGHRSNDTLIQRNRHKFLSICQLRHRAMPLQSR